MLKKKFFVAMIFVPFIGFTQTNPARELETDNSKGLFFENGLSFQELMTKAKAENKYVFFDCFTTWCAPCKKMEKEIYPLASVGSIYNKNFISIKIQMDKTPRDNESVKAWYSVADSIKEKYQINAYPTYIFFKPDGEPLHRVAGALREEKFIEMAKDALNPDKQSYIIQKRYDEEKKFNIKMMSDDELKQMATSIKYTNPQLADKLAFEFISRLKSNESFKDNYNFIGLFGNDLKVNKIATKYINSLRDEEMYQLFRKENLGFVLKFIKTSNDRAFKFLLHNSEKVDSVMNKEYEHKLQYSYMWINKVIIIEDVNPFLAKAGLNPNWMKLHELIKSKYNNYYADINVLLAKIDWYSRQKDWKNYATHIVKYMDSFGTDLQNSWYLNQYAWEVFKYSNSNDELSKALSWSLRAVTNAPIANWIDTYANILYKLGQERTAIKWMEIAVTLEPNDKEFQRNLNKMNNREVTWGK